MKDILKLSRLFIIPWIFYSSFVMAGNESDSAVDNSFTNSFPPFLPDYYKNAFPDGFALWKAKGSTQQSDGFAEFEKIDSNESLSVQYIKATRSSLNDAFRYLVARCTKEIIEKGGRFMDVSARTVKLEVIEGDHRISTINILGTPKAIYVWRLTLPLENTEERKKFYDSLSTFAGCQRYQEALAEGNVHMGAWEDEIHEYAKLVSNIDKGQAEVVYSNHLKTSPYNYPAHLEYLRLSANQEERVKSAKAILNDAEDLALLNEAARYLQLKVPALESYPELEKNERGLQLILIPLPPCNPWVLEECSRLYEKITGIPVKIRRLRSEWKLGKPERFWGQRTFEKILSQANPLTAGFEGWDEKQFKEEIIKFAQRSDPLSDYMIKDLLNKTEKEQGQWEIDKYLDWFLTELSKYRSKDVQTMYVGITEIDIYSGDVNFLFSLHGWYEGFPASSLSYSRMLAKNSGEPYQSRLRLVERIAKELVPASLKSLSIPRSIDPTCPYSYADGIDRLDQKTLLLSDEVKDAIDKFRRAAKPAESKEG